LVGRIAGGEAAPGGIGADLPEDAVEYTTGIEGGTTTPQVSGRYLSTNCCPLPVGQVHLQGPMFIE
jgi:hypothetical protein